MGDSGSRRTVQPHAYSGDGITDSRGDDRCAHCGLPKARADVHTLPDVPEQAEHHRRTGK